jgi:hypothetical protein
MFETEVMKLMEEVDRYLAAVDLFRSLDCEPTWRLESPPAVAIAHTREIEQQIRSAH